MISNSGSIGKLAIADDSPLTNRTTFQKSVAIIKPKHNLVLSKFLYFYLLFAKNQFNQYLSGTAQKNLLLKDLRSFKIPLPPLEEQHRIAAILDKADAIHRKRFEAIRLTEELLRAVFLDMFGDPSRNPYQWKKSCIGDIAEMVTDGTHHTPIRSESGVMLLSARNIKNGYIDTSESVDYIPQAEYERLKKRYDPAPQDVLISCSGSVGRVTVVRHCEPFSMVRSVAVVRPKLNVINSEYLESLLHTNYLQMAILKGAKQSSQANLFQGAIKELPIFVPPIKLQERWQVLKLRLKQNIKRYLDMEETHRLLFNSLMHRAFRGEL